MPALLTQRFAMVRAMIWSFGGGMPGLTRTRKSLIAAGLLLSIGGRRRAAYGADRHAGGAGARSRAARDAAGRFHRWRPGRPRTPAATITTPPETSTAPVDATQAPETAVDLRPGSICPRRRRRSRPSSNSSRSSDRNHHHPHQYRVAATQAGNRRHAGRSRPAERGARSPPRSGSRRAETDVVAIEDRLGELIVEEFEVRGRLDGSNASISNALAALERISRNPPPALIVDPVRCARFGPQRHPDRGHPARTAGQGRTGHGRSQDASPRSRPGRSAEEQHPEGQPRNPRGRAAAHQARSSRRARPARPWSPPSSPPRQKEAEELAARASSLRAADRRPQQTGRRACRKRRRPPPRGQFRRLTRRAARTRYPSGWRSPISSARNPAVPFAQAKGWLTMPSSGVRVIEYGAGDGFGGISQGLSVVTRAEATVVAPGGRLGALQGRLPQLWPNHHSQYGAEIHRTSCRPRLRFGRDRYNSS